MRICLAIGDRQGEEYIKSSLTQMIECINRQGVDQIETQIRSIYDSDEFDDATKKAKKAEILLSYFGGHKFLSKLSLTTILHAKDSGVTSVEFVDEAPYRECVSERCSNGVDVLILSEMLEGQMDFQALCQDLKVNRENTRIIVLGGAHEKGDVFLRGLTRKAIYDISYGEQVNLLELFKLIFKPNTYADSLKYLNNSQTSSVGKENKEQIVKKPLKVEPVVNDEPVQEKKGFLGGVVKKESSTPPAPTTPSHDTDLFMEEAPVTNSSSGTELFSDDETIRDGLVCYPYDMKPLLVTDRKTKESVIVNPDGTREQGTNLPAPIKTPRDQMYELYISSLMTDGSANRGVIREQPVHPQQSMNYGVKAKSILFTSTIQGVGCSTMAFNLAVLCAMDRKKKVLFIDANLGDSSSYARLEIPQNLGVSLDDLMREPTREKEVLNKEILVTKTPKNHAARMSYLPDTLSYITWGKDIATNLAWVTENIDKFNDVLNRLSFLYDYIVIDSSLILSNAVNDALFQFATVIVPVVTQDIYSTNMTANQIHTFDKYNIASKVKVLCNRYETCPPLTTDSFSSDFYNSNVYPIFDDNKGFIRSASQGLPYVLTKSSNRKILKSMRLFLNCL